MGDAGELGPMQTLASPHDVPIPDEKKQKMILLTWGALFSWSLVLCQPFGCSFLEKFTILCLVSPPSLRHLMHFARSALIWVPVTFRLPKSVTF